jgi:hypothetical protein
LIYVLAGALWLGAGLPFVASAATIGEQATHAIQLVGQGDYETARSVLRRAVSGRPDAPLHLAQLEGLILRQQGRNREAVEVFRFILSREPNFTPARIELSRALTDLGDSDAALHQLQVIELGSDDPEIRRQARSFGESVKDQRPYGFSGYLSVLPSTNVNRGSGHTVVKVGDMDFEIDEEGREKSGVGLGAGGNAYRSFYLDQQSRLTWAGSVDLKNYSGSEFDELSLSTNLSLARRFGRLELQAGPIVDYRLLAWEPYAFRYGFSLGGSFELGPHTRAYSGGTYLRQDFHSLSHRDGWTFLGYAGVRHAFSPSLVVSLTGNLGVERTQRDYLDHDDLQISAQVDREWSGGLITSFALGAGVHDYAGEFPGLGVARQDKVWSAGTTLMSRTLSFNGFAPQLQYEYTRQHSNVSFYDYDSHDINVIFTKRF